MVKVMIKNKSLVGLHDEMKKFAKIYKDVELKYDYKNKTAVLTLKRRKNA